MTKYRVFLLLFVATVLFSGCAAQKQEMPTFATLPTEIPVGTAPAPEGEEEMATYDFSQFSNVTVSGVELADLDETQLAVLYQLTRYSQAMTDMDAATLDAIVADEMTFTHMSGRQQTKAEYLSDIERGALRYFTVGIENPVVEVNGNIASVSHSHVLDANAYGAVGVYRFNTTRWFENRDGVWTVVPDPER